MVEKIKYIVNVVTVALLLATVAIQRDGRVVGYDVDELFQKTSVVDVPIETTLNDGTRVINTASLAKDVVGFGGRTPVNVYVKDGVIQKIEAESNSETPSFMDVVSASGLFDSWSGMQLSDAATHSVDIVSGATYTSQAIIDNVKRGAQYGADVSVSGSNIFANVGIKEIVALLVILMGVCITIFKTRNRWLMMIQLLLNVIVLGCWCGSFISLATLTSWMGSGVNLSVSLVTFAMLCVVIILPLFGKKGSYCHVHCPMGSAQELLWRVPIVKFNISLQLAKVLNALRYYILVALLFIMWLGVGFDLMNYEVFSVFIVGSASTPVIVMAAIFLLLSLFVHRPYCRFVCPTGALITMSQKTK